MMRGRSKVVSSDSSSSSPPPPTPRAGRMMYDPMASSASAPEEPRPIRQQPSSTAQTSTPQSQKSLGHRQSLIPSPPEALLPALLLPVPRWRTGARTRSTSRPFRRPAAAVSPQRPSHSTFRLGSVAYPLVALLLLLLGPHSATAQQCNPLQIYVYDDEAQCESRNTPSAVGKLFADASCRATQVQSSQSSSATFLLPGRYSAECVSGEGDYGQVRFLQSGCTSSTCSSSSSSSTSCDRDASSPASYYSRLNPPVYDVQALNNNFICYTLGSNNDSIVFAIFGDCSGVTTDDGIVCGNTETPAPSPSGGGSEPTSTEATEQPTDSPIATTSEPTPPPSPRPATRRPSAAPVADPAPTTDDEPTPSPTTPPDTDAPSLAPAPDTPQPIALATSDPGPEASPTRPPRDGNGGGGGQGPPPTAKEENPSTTNNNSNSSTSNIGIIAGAVLGALLALACVLAAGFYAGALRQRNKQASTGQMSPTDPDHGGFGTTWIPATAASSSAAHSKEIVVDPNHQDDVSTLGTPWGVMSAGIGGATVVVEDGTVAQHSLAWDYKPHEPSLADDSQGTHTFVSAPTQTGPITGGMMAGGAGAATHGGSPRVRASSLLADDTSFEKLYDDDEKDYYDTEIEDDNPGSSSQGLRFTVSVPAGKLGMVIDNTPGSVPEVRALKPDSVLVSRGVLVGDYLEQVDGLDVRDWTCLQVSQMIQNKSGQRTRELVFYRKPRGSMGGAVYTISEL